MRLGCSGCLLGVVLTCLLGGAVAVTVWAAGSVLQAPVMAPIVATRADWVSAQQKLFDLSRGRRGRPGAVALTERELTAVAARYVGDSADLPLRDTGVRVQRNGTLEIAGRVPLRIVLAETALAPVADVMPSAWADRPVWMTFRVRPRLERWSAGRRELRLDLQGFTLGRRSLPTFLPRLLLSPAALRFLSIPVPDTIESVEVEPERLVLRTSGS